MCVCAKIFFIVLQDSSSHIPRRASLGVHGYLLVYNIASFASFKAIQDINTKLLCAVRGDKNDDECDTIYYL